MRILNSASSDNRVTTSNYTLFLAAEAEEAEQLEPIPLCSNDLALQLETLHTRVWMCRRVHPTPIQKFKGLETPYFSLAALLVFANNFPKAWRLQFAGRRHGLALNTRQPYRLIKAAFYSSIDAQFILSNMTGHGGLEANGEHFMRLYAVRCRSAAAFQHSLMIFIHRAMDNYGRKSPWLTSCLTGSIVDTPGFSS